jgi:hypothetical protein
LRLSPPAHLISSLVALFPLFSELGDCTIERSTLVHDVAFGLSENLRRPEAAPSKMPSSLSFDFPCVTRVERQRSAARGARVFSRGGEHTGACLSSGMRFRAPRETAYRLRCRQLVMVAGAASLPSFLSWIGEDVLASTLSGRIRSAVCFPLR